MLKVSVIVPVYNAQDYLKECLSSIVNQTMDENEYEIILVDDCSCDNSLQIASEYSRLYRNIVVINNSVNRGVSATLNTGIRVAKGKYIYIIACDDTIEKNLLTECYNTAEENNADVVYFGYKCVYDCRDKENGKFIFRNNEIILDEKIESNKIYSGKEIFKISHWLGPEFIYFINRNFFEHNDLWFNEQTVIDDLEFSPRLFMSVDRFIKLNEVLYNYTVRTKSLSNNVKSKNRVSSVKKCIESLFRVKKLCTDDSLDKSFKMYFFLLFDQLIRYTQKEYENDRVNQIVKAVNELIPKYMSIFGCGFLDDEFLYFCKLKSEINKESVSGNKVNILPEVEKVFNTAQDRCTSIRERVLASLPLSEKGRLIGIYGMGRHSISLINSYIKLIGNIECELIFIDSYCTNDEKFLGKRVININKINEYEFDSVIISSCTFEKEIYKVLSHKLQNEIKIYRFYEKLQYPIFY